MSTFLQVKDNAETTLNGAIDNSTLTIVVSDGSVLPTTGNQFVISIDSEDILCDSRSTNTLTANTRGYNGTVAASHANGATVSLFVLAKHIQDLDDAVVALEAKSPPSVGSGGEALLIDQSGATNYLPLGFAGMLNGRIVTSVASSDLTVAIKGLDGNDPSTTNPVYVRIGNTIRSITSALSVTKNDGTNWFDSGSAGTATAEVDYFVYLIWNTTATPDAVSVGFARVPYGTLYSHFSGTTTNSLYLAFSGSDTPAATDECQLVGRFNATLSAGAGYTWSIPATSIVIQHPIFETRNLSWTPGYTGFSANPSIAYAQYRVFGRNCHIYYQINGGGTSNSTAFTMTQLPFSSYVNNMVIGGLRASNNGAVINTNAWGDLTGTGLTFYTNWDGSGWTAANSKFIYSLNFDYPISG